MARNDLPTGTVTFLFTDIEGSTKLLHELGPDAYAEALAEHRRVVRTAFARHGGVEVDTQGDAFFIAFPTAPGAVGAAQEAQEALARSPVRVRMGVHTGTPHVTEEGYVGSDVHKAARIAAAGHGGQVLISKETRELLVVEATDLGEHRLKDFSRPVWIFQLGTERFPPLRAISNTNLPRPASSFVGREGEVTDVAAQLRDGARLLTLTGPGGSGKTRLAIEAAAALVPEFKNGVFWVGLAALRDPTLVFETVAQTVGAKGGLAEHIGDRELLLLLDNFEQVVEAAPELPRLLESCPNLRLLVTSREVLRVKGEVAFAVPPLADPDAVELFCTRSRLEPGEAIAELCRRLDNLPLAVELAAARTSVLTPEQILARLSQRLDLLKGGRDTEARQQTLRATIAWSHSLLTEKEQRLFARLAVFAGGCPLEAAEEVAEGDLDLLQSLVEKSLLRRTGDRFWMLETIREFAAEMLERSPEAESAHRAHADWVLGVVDPGVEPPLVRRDKEWFARVEREFNNVRRAFAWLVQTGAYEHSARLAIQAFQHWARRGPLSEVRRWLEESLQGPELPAPLRRDVLWALCQVTRVQGDGERCRSAAEEGLALSRRLDPEGPMVVEALRDLGIGYGILGDVDRQVALHEEALALARKSGIKDRRVTILVGNLADTELIRGRWSRSRELSREALALVRELDTKADREREAIMPLHNMGVSFLMESRLGEAKPLFLDALQLAQEGGWHQLMPEPLECLAAILAAQGDLLRAARLLGTADAIRREVGSRPTGVEAELLPKTIATVRAALGDEAYEGAFAEGAALDHHEAVARAMDDDG